MLLIRKRMLELLKGRNMSVTNLAIAVGASRSHMSNVLAGRKKLNLKSSRRLIGLFGAEAISKAIDWESMKISKPWEV